MTTNGYGTAAQASSAGDIDKVDAFARQLFRRTRNAGIDFSDVSMIVYGLHTVLKHLKAEAEDPDSLLNSGDKSRYIRQLTPILEDCEFTLQQLDTILERCGGSGSGSEGDGRNASSLNGFERDKIALIRTKLANQRLNIDMFLDTVQLHNPARSHPAVDTSNANLDSIKDKVDVIAARIFQRESSNASAGVVDDDLWRQFRNELEQEGFSKDVLRRNQVRPPTPSIIAICLLTLPRMFFALTLDNLMSNVQFLAVSHQPFVAFLKAMSRRTLLSQSRHTHLTQWLLTS